MSSANSHTHTASAEETQVIIYGHSWLLYWWPVWLIGYVMAVLTWMPRSTRQILNIFLRALERDKGPSE
jgi:hypothetical protein